MKKNTIICLFGLTAILLSGCSVKQQAQVEKLDVEQAKAVALADAGLTAQGVTVIGSEIKRRDGFDYYTVEFATEGETITYDIDALTGTVISKDRMVVTPVGETTAGIVAVTAEQAAIVPTDAVSGATPKTASAVASGEVSVTPEQAKAKALEHAGVTAEQVTFVQANLDNDHGKTTYDVEFYTQGKEYDYEIDATTCEIISYDFDADHYAPSEAGTAGTQISKDRAKEIALEQVSGAKVSDIYEFETDYDDGRLAYEGKIIYGGREYEFEIDGYSGAIRSWESEPVKRR